LSGAAASDRVDDVEPLPPAPRELEDDLGRILEVRVHHDDGIPRRKVETGRDRGLVPEVPRELEHLEARVSSRRLDHAREAVVSTAVVYENDLRLAIELLQEEPHSLEQRRQDLLLVEDGDYQRVLRWRRGPRSPAIGRRAHDGDQRRPGSKPQAKLRRGGQDGDRLRAV